VRSEIDYWCFAGLDDSPRGLSAEALIEKLPETFLKATKPANPCKILPTNACMEVSVQQACKWVLSKAKASDRIIIFGSFYTVTQAMQHFSHTAHIK
jgi:folylpolyglutamate synthase/dihydropteroate synthase